MSRSPGLASPRTSPACSSAAAWTATSPRSQPPLLSNDGYATWDLRAAYRLVGPLSVTIAADNLADADYMDPLGYLALGRAFRIGARVGF